MKTRAKTTTQNGKLEIEKGFSVSPRWAPFTWAAKENRKARVNVAGTTTLNVHQQK